MAESDRTKWDDKYRKGEHTRGQAPGWLRDLDAEIPVEGAALDVAAGSGRVAIWLARRGLEVTAVDISPVGLALAREAAADENVRLTTVVVDLEKAPLPDGPFDVVTCFHYRQRELYPSLISALAPAGIILVELPTTRNLERTDVGRPRPSKRWLAEPNELLQDLSGLSVLFYAERWVGGRHLARMVAQRTKI